MAMLDNQMVFVKCGLSSPVWIFSMDGTSFYDSHWGEQHPGYDSEGFSLK
jgi:hypothetical protein